MMIVKSKSLRLACLLMAVIICVAFMPFVMFAGKASAENGAYPYKVKIEGTDKPMDVYSGAATVFPDDLIFDHAITIEDDKGVSREFKYSLLDYYDKDGKKMSDYGYNIHNAGIWYDKDKKPIPSNDPEDDMGENVYLKMFIYKCDEMGRPLDKDGNTRDKNGNKIVPYDAEWMGTTDFIQVKIKPSTLSIVKKRLTYAVSMLDDKNSAQVFVDNDIINPLNIKGKVTVPSNVTIEGRKYPVRIIGEPGFYKCLNLKEVVLPKTLTTIEVDTFADTGLKKITIPDSVTRIATGSIGVKMKKPVKGFVIYAKHNPVAEDYAYSIGLKYIDRKAAKAFRIKMKKASSKKGKATLKWQKNKYVTGYKIYKAKKKNGKYKLVANIKKASKAKWTSKKQKRGRKVFYKMRPYTKISDKTYYGKWSKVKRVKIK